MFEAYIGLHNLHLYMDVHIHIYVKLFVTFYGGSGEHINKDTIKKENGRKVNIIFTLECFLVVTYMP